MVDFDINASIQRGLEQSAAGEVVDLGSFVEYADNYLESLDQWAKDTSDTELINESERLSTEWGWLHKEIEKRRMELMQWEMSLKTNEEQMEQIVAEIDKRHLFSANDEPEGPERYYSSPGELW